MKEWRAGTAKFPRPALQPIADALRKAMGPQAQEISANLGGRNFFDVLQVDSTGRTLWAEAADKPVLGGSKGTDLPKTAGRDAERILADRVIDEGRRRRACFQIIRRTLALIAVSPGLAPL